nr:hypothetical protein [Streptomyces tsukubensis NRRL18488]
MAADGHPLGFEQLPDVVGEGVQGARYAVDREADGLVADEEGGGAAREEDDDEGLREQLPQQLGPGGAGPRGPS